MKAGPTPYACKRAKSDPVHTDGDCSCGAGWHPDGILRPIGDVLWAGLSGRSAGCEEAGVCQSAEAPPRVAHRFAWGEAFSRAAEHLRQRSLELRDSLRAG